MLSLPLSRGRVRNHGAAQGPLEVLEALQVAHVVDAHLVHRPRVVVETRAEFFGHQLPRVLAGHAGVPAQVGHDAVKAIQVQVLVVYCWRCVDG